MGEGEIAPFPTVFSKDLYCRQIKTRACFPTVFFTCLDNFLPFSSNWKLSSAKSFNLEKSKICRLVMG